MYKKIEVDKSIIDIIHAPIPRELKRNTPDGYKYISGANVISFLNQAFGVAGWDFKILHAEKVESEPFRIKGTKEDIPQGKVIQVLGELTVYFTDENGNMFSRSRQQYGSQPIVGKQGQQEHAYKGATTDCLKKCATMFGIALELSQKEDEKEYWAMAAEEEFDPWAEPGVQEAHQEEIDFLQDLIKNDHYDITREDLNETVKNFTGGKCKDIGLLDPDEMTRFVEYLKKAIADNEKEPV